MFDVLVIGGGAAGFYGAIQVAIADPSLKIGILERGRQGLSKVKISGGGRCNVTHAEFDPHALAANYPRGDKELLGPFHHYGSGDIMGFFEERGVALKSEEDGRIFPVSDSSQTIIDCFLREIKDRGVQLMYNSPVTDLEFDMGEQHWLISTKTTGYRARKVLLATGSNHKVWHMLQRLGHTIVPPVPSLFTFNIKDERLAGIQGISTGVRIGVLEKHPPGKGASLILKNTRVRAAQLESEGPMLITHWGISGPAVLKLSAWGARLLYDCHYRFQVRVNWIPEYHEGAVFSVLTDVREVEAKKTVLRTHAFDLPRRLWTKLVLASGISRAHKWADLTKTQMEALVQQLTASEFQVDGKSTFKEEFVTAGGVDLREIDFRTFQSKRLPNLFFAGEVINADAITGGFNFQNAWTGAYIAARAITSSQ